MMGMFIFIVVVMSIVGSFFSLMVTSNMDNSKPWVRGVVGVLVAVAFGLLMTGMMWAESAHDEKAWNNGVCHECGQAWEFKSADHVKSGGDRYYWTCDDCQEVICIKHIMP